LLNSKTCAGKPLLKKKIPKVSIQSVDYAAYQILPAHEHYGHDKN